MENGQWPQLQCGWLITGKWSLWKQREDTCTITTSAYLWGSHHNQI